jgi:hypothetical protein
MDTKVAAEGMFTYVDSADLPDEHPEYGKDHLRYMLVKMIEGEIEGEKAHRWLGWVQGCVCVGGGASLEELKMVNKLA